MLKHIGFKGECSSLLFAIPPFGILQEDKSATLLSLKTMIYNHEV